MKRKIYSFALLMALCLLTGCTGEREPRGGGGGDELPSDTTKVEVAPVKAKHINVFIENTASMDGYLNGETRFKDAISYLLVQLDYYYTDSVKVHLINNKTGKTTLTQVDIGNFAKAIDIHWANARRVQRGDTDLTLLFQDILNETDEESISILFADCVYSPGESTDGRMAFLGNSIIKTFNDKLRTNSGPFSTTIAKMNSEFNGLYFPRSGNSERFQLQDENRPYYICVLANQEIMDDFNTNPKLKLNNLSGFENKYVLSPKDNANFYYSILSSINDNVGRFKPEDGKVSNGKFIRSIEDVKLETQRKGGEGNSRFTVAVAVDLKEIEAEEDYLMNPENYTLEDDHFIVKEVRQITKSDIKSEDKVMIQKAQANPTHLIVLEATGTALSDVTVSLKKQVPQWVADSNIENDARGNQASLKEGKTFGLRYWIDGIAEAYQTHYPEDINFFEFEVKIKR